MINPKIQKTRDQVIDDLRHFILEVKFRKLDGTERLMICTLAKEHIPEAFAGTSRKKTLDVISAFDVEKMEWRSFRFDSINSIHAYVRV